MASNGVVVCVFLVFGLIYSGAESAQIMITKTSDLNNVVNTVRISCSASDIVSSATEVDLMQILKENSDHKSIMLAHIDRLSNLVRIGHKVPSTHQATGSIDKVRNSHLVLTLSDPKVEDQGQYMCEIYFKDNAGVLQRTASTGTLLLPKPKVIEKDVSADLKRLQTQIDQLTSQVNKQGIDFSQKIQEEKTTRTSIISSLDKAVKEINYQLINVGRKGYVSETKLEKDLKNLKNTLDEDFDKELTKLNASLVEVKASLEQDLSEVETDADQDLKSHLLNTDKIIKNFARKVSETINRAANTETLIGQLAKKISLLSDKVSVLDFLVQSSVDPEPDATSKSTNGAMANLQGKVNALEQNYQNLSKDLAFLFDKDLKANHEIIDLAKVTNHLKQAVDACSCEQDEFANMTAFTATIKRPFQTKMGEVIIFDEVMLNKGHGYNPKTGEFTALRSGIYAFDLILMTRIDDEWLDVDLQTNNDVLVRLTSKENEREDQNAVSVLAKLQAGDKVTAVVKHTAAANTTKLVPLNFSTLSGYFVQPL